MPMSLIPLLLCLTPTLGDVSTWSDKSGRFSVEAEFVRLDGETVVLRDAGGEELEVSLDALSADDQTRARRAAETMAENPFQRRQPSSPFQKRGTDQAQGINDPTGPARTIEIRTGRQDVLDPDQVLGELSLSPVEEPGRLRLPGVGLRFSARISNFDDLLGVVVAREASRAVLGYDVHKFSDAAEGGQLTVVDLSRGKADAPVRIETAEAPLWLSPDGQRLLTRSHAFGFGNSSRLTLWSLGRRPAAVWHIRPFSDRDGIESDISWAGMLSGTTAAACSRRGLFRVLDVESGVVSYEGQINTLAAPSVSDDGTKLVIPGERRVGVYEADTLAALGSVEIDGLQPLQASLTADQSRLMVAGSSSLRVFDAATGKPVGFSPHTAPADWQWAVPLEHADGPYYFVGPQVVDVENHFPVWTYTGAVQPKRFGDETLLFYASSGKDKTTALAVAGPLPHALPRRLRDAAVADPKLLLLQPGDTVQASVGPMPLAGKQAELQSQLEDGLRERGFRVAAAAEKTLSLTMARGPSRTVTYKTFGAGGADQQVTVRPWVAKLELKVAGKSVWSDEREVSDPNFMISMKAGETAQQAVSKRDNPVYESFRGFLPPATVTNPEVVGPTGLGSSTLGSRGLIDSPAKMSPGR